MHQEIISYKCDEQTFHGYLFHNTGVQGIRPGILVCHAWKGVDEVTKQKAKELARLGYIVFAADVYGNDQPIKTNEEALHQMGPLFTNRALLLKRVTAGYNTLQQHALVDKQRMGTIGFCFGGLTTLELFKSSPQGLRGAVTFHGLLGDRMGPNVAQTVPMAANIKASLLILHGHDDPLVSKEDIASTQEKLTKAGIDWQMHLFGHATHAFSNADANEPSSGLLYNEKADRRSWQMMTNFFSEIFQFN
jgi:dienelactone hydrolase